MEKAKKKGATAETSEDTVSFFHSVINQTLVDLTLEAEKEICLKDEQCDNTLSLSATHMCRVMLHYVTVYRRRWLIVLGLPRGVRRSTRLGYSISTMHPIHHPHRLLVRTTKDSPITNC